jgi:hypothetical protein
VADFTLEEMYADLEAADAEGDTATAQAIADRIKAAEYTGGRQKEAEGIKAQQRSMGQKGVTGAKQGAVRLWEGLKQLNTAIGEAMGVMPEGAVMGQTADMMADRFEATGGDPDIESAADISEAALSAVPGIGMLRGAGALPKLKDATTVLRTVGQGMRGGAAAGLVSGASETAETSSEVLGARALQAGIGAGLGGSMALAIGAKPLVQNYLTRLRENADQSTATLEVGRHALLDVGKLTLSQQSGNVVARNLEVQAYATRAQNFFVDQFKRFADSAEGAFAGIRRAASSQNPDELQTAAKIHKAWNKQAAATQQAASRQYGGRVAKSLSLAGQDAAKYPLPIDNLSEVTAKWTSETGGQPWWRKIHPGADKMSAEFESLDRYLKGIAENNARMNAPPGQFATPRIGTVNEGISVQEMIMARRALNMEDQAYWRAVDAGSVPTPAQFDAHRAVKEMRNAMDADIDGYLASANPDRASVKALQEFRDANKEYGQFGEFKKFMRNTASAQYFSGAVNKAGFDPGKALDEIVRRSPLEQTILANTLRSADPSALADLRAVVVNRALQAMQDPSRQAARGLVDPEKFAKALYGEYGTVAQQIFEPGQLAQVNKALNTVRVIQNGPEGVISVSRAPSVESTGMAIVSGSRAFLTRAFSEEGLKSLEVLRSANAGTWRGPASAVTKAIAKVGAVATQGEIPDEYVTVSNE